MKKQHIKQTNNSWVLPKRKLLKNILVITGLLLGLNCGVVAQNASYNNNSVPISGTNSSAFGFEALKSNTGNYNTAIGFRALYSNTSGAYNTANGFQALFSNIEGNHNTANGLGALRSNTTGNYNTANGSQALYSNTTGSLNTASGFQALYSNTTGIHNTASGQQALYSNTTGSYNTAGGLNALRFNNTGSNNTAFGHYALYSNTTGNWNTANGNHTLNENTTGNANTANGYAALYANTTGINNTANGYSALYSNTTGNWNTANGSHTLNENTTGSYNTANGFAALLKNNTGNYNTALGLGADVTFDSLNYATAIGARAKVTASNTIQLGNDSVTRVYAGVGKNATLIAGGLQITGGIPAVGKVLTSDASGTATWQSPASTGWSLTGNTGTIDGTNFIGTTDNIPFNIRVNNQKAGRIENDISIDKRKANTFYGYQAGNANAAGYNTANGYQALYANTTGDGNTAIGDRSMSANTEGNYNTAVGSLALNSNIDGRYNTAIGYNADVNAGLTNATAIGSGAKVTDSNTIQLGDNTVTKVYAGTATNATLIAGTLQATSGAINTATSPVLTIDVNNEKAGRIDANNAFYGYQSGNARTTGGFNTANGYQALYANTTGDGNTAIGDRSMSANTEGNYNTAIGSLALNTSTKGKYNTAIGYNADIADKDKMGNDITNATAIGNAAWVDESNKVVIGDRNVTVIGGYANWSNLSDARFKKNIQQDVHGLDFITKLNPITYNLDVKKLNSFLGVDERNAKLQQQPSTQQAQAIATKEAIRYTGFLAQEVEQAAQTVNYNFSGVIKPASDKGHYSMSYSDFVVPLVKAVQEQEKKIEQQDQKIEDQQKQIDELKKLVTQITGGNNVTKDVATKEVGTANAEDINLLYPNPTTGICTITTSNIDNGVIEIYDMAGNSMQKTTFNNAKSGYQLNVSGYAKGVYLLNIIANNKKYTKRLVIQ